MSRKKIASFAELEAANEMQYAEVDVYGITVRIGDLSTADMMEWLKENDDKEKRKEAGLRLVTRCLVSEEGKRLNEEERDSMLAKLRKKNASHNKILVSACLHLTGLDEATQQVLKNASPEARTADSPSGSPDTSAR